MREIALHLLDIAENSVAADARTITLAITEDLKSDRLELAVQDDGKGFSQSPGKNTPRTQGGFGMLGIKERAALLGGDFNLQTAPGQGTRITVRIPLQGEAGNG